MQGGAERSPEAGLREPRATSGVRTLAPRPGLRGVGRAGVGGGWGGVGNGSGILIGFLCVFFPKQLSILL